MLIDGCLGIWFVVWFAFVGFGCDLFVCILCFFGCIAVGMICGVVCLYFGFGGVIVHGRSRFGVEMLSFDTLAWFCLFLICLVCVYCWLFLFGYLRLVCFD